MTTFSYRQLLKNSWEITWNNKILWVFGFFAVTLLGNNRAYNFILNNLDLMTQEDLTGFYTFRLYRRALTSWGPIANLFSNIGNLIFNRPLAFFLSALLGLIIIAGILVLVWFVIISQICLIKNIGPASRNKKIEFKKSIKQATKYFWPVFGLNLLVQVIIYFFFLLLVYPSVAYTQIFSEAATILNFIFFLIFIPLSLILAFLAIYASSYIILENQKLFEAIRSAWNLFLKNWLLSLEISLILILINLLAVIGLIVLIILLGIPFILFSIIFYFLASDFGLFLLAIIAIAGLIILISVFTAILSTFQYTTWTLLFLQLTERGATSKIVEAISSSIDYLKREAKE